MTQREHLISYLRDTLHMEPSVSRSLASDTLFFRTADGKSFARFQTVSDAKYGGSNGAPVCLLTLRCDLALSGSLRLQNGFCPAYCAPPTDWISVRLDNSVPTDMLITLLMMSLELTADGSSMLKQENIREWLIPANPKYFDLFKAFQKSDIILWKQSSNIAVGDIVYMYVAAPYSAILFCCKAVEVDIPYTRKNRNRNITRAMRIQLLHAYDGDTFSLKILKDYDITTVRGPRGVPAALSTALKKAAGIQQ